MINDMISHALIPGRLAKQKVVQAELEEKLSKSEENLTVAQTKSNVSRSFHRKRCLPLCLLTAIFIAEEYRSREAFRCFHLP